MGSIETVTSSGLSLSSQQSFDSPNRSGHLKTLDIGLDGNTSSTNPFGDKLLDYVHSGKRGFGLHLTGAISNLKSETVANNINVTYSLGRVQVTTTVSVGKDHSVVQYIILKSSSTQIEQVDYTLALNISVNRASYGQLTEGGPIPIPPPSNKFQLADGSQAWAVVNQNLDAMIQGDLYCDDFRVCLEPMKRNNTALDQPVSMAFHETLKINPGQTRTLTSRYLLQPRCDFAKIPSPRINLEPNREEGWKVKNENMRLIIKGNLSYILGNCAVPVGSSATFRYLLDIYQHMNRLLDASTAQEYLSKIRTVVCGHLNWVFRVAQRPHGYWHRSYLATGVPKDRSIFQLDQQCYPILELCDFLHNFPSEMDLVKSILTEETIPSILSILELHRDPSTGLYSTEETPGDDAVEHPFHFSSHILLWHTLARLAKTLSKLKFASGTLNPECLKQKAERLQTATLRHFVACNPATGTTMFAYLTDGAGVHTFYHDANDLPTLFIPTWRFADPSSPEHALWTRTMEFGLSPLNTDGFFPQGPYGGLGSVHTRGPWPLGFAQEFIFASLLGDRAAIEDAWRRIQGSMFMDGLFSEAVNAENGECTSKAWFSWPGCVISSALIKFEILGEEAWDHEE
ncbi:Six-hairpin glycosidase-like protein [Hyaloscypha sp. PMI_1271]|nr:Six-hairpin glycosidase-like protein [Hyaloscypha sp. PMI_1271]